MNKSQTVTPLLGAHASGAPQIPRARDAARLVSSSRHGLQLGDSRSADVGPSARRSGSKVRLRATAAVTALSPACRGSMAARSPSGMLRALAARIEEHDDRRTVIDALCATSALRSDRAESTTRPTHATPPYVLCARHCGRAARSTARSVANQAATSSPPARAAVRCRTAARGSCRFDAVDAARCSQRLLRMSGRAFAERRGDIRCAASSAVVGSSSLWHGVQRVARSISSLRALPLSSLSPHAKTARVVAVDVPVRSPS